MSPPDSSRAAVAFVQLAGSPIRMAVATVSGSATGVPEDDRRRAGRLEAVHPGPAGAEPSRVVVQEAGPVGADVAGVADRDGEDVRSPAQVVADLERRRLLTGEPIRVDRVHERHRVGIAGGELADDPQRRIEVAVDRHDPRPGDERLEQLPGRDPALRQDDDDLHAGGGAIGGGRRGRVPGRRTDDRARAGLERPAHGHDHPAILEAAGRVRPLDLQVEVRQTELAAEGPGVDERGEPFAEAQVGGGSADRQEPSIAIDETGSRRHPELGHPSTG